jgi:hypothetical protein
MENNNEFQQAAQSQTAKMIAAILRGESPKGSDNPTPTDKTHQDVLREIETTYRQIVQPETAPVEEQK